MGLSMLFIFQRNCKPQCQTILFHYVCWRLRVGGRISHYMVNITLHRKDAIWGTNFIRLIEEIWAHDIFLNLYVFFSSIFTRLLVYDSCQKEKCCAMLMRGRFLHVIWMCCVTQALMIMYDSCWPYSFILTLLEVCNSLPN